MMFAEIAERYQISLSNTLKGIQQFGGAPRAHGKKNVLKIVTNSSGYKELVVIPQDQMGWFDFNSLGKVCAVATIAVKVADRDSSFKGQKGIEELRQRVLHYGTKHGLTRDMVGFLEAADEYSKLNQGIGGVFQRFKKIFM